MITYDNAKEVFSTLLTTQEIEEAIDQPGDFLLIELYIFNTGAAASIKAKDYNEEEEREANDNGNLFIDKDDFLRLLDEYNIPATTEQD